MLRKSIATFFCLFVLTAALRAQAGFGAPLPDATVGVTYSFDFGSALSQLLATEPFPPDAGISFSFNFNPSSGTTLPPGLSLQSNGVLSGVPTTPGMFIFSIDVNFKLVIDGQTVFDQPIPITQALTVTGTSTARAVVDPQGLAFAFNQGSSGPAGQSITITNKASSAKTFTASVSQNAGGSLSLSPSSGSISAFSSSSVLVTANPAGLVAGTYPGKISISVSPTGESFDIPVLVTVTSSQLSIQLSQTGLRFQSVQGGGAPPSQVISVINGGGGTLSFSVSATTLSPGSWLSVSPSSGSSSNTSSTPVTVSVNPAGLAPGNYYGQIQFISPNAANSPQTASVVLNVFAANASPGAFVNPTGLIFIATAGATAPASKTVSIANPSPTPLTFSSAAQSPGGVTFFTATPTSGNVNSGTPATVTVKPVLTGLGPGVYRGELDLAFSDGSIRRVAVILIVIPAGTSPAGLFSASPLADPPAAGCTPTKLIPVFTQLGAGFKVTAGWPTPIEVTVVDDCGTAMTAGSVSASFSSGDPALQLGSLKDGRWTATWQPRTTSSTVTITVKAQQVQPLLQGSEQIGGAAQANTSVPIISAGGVVSAASFAPQQPISPGTYIAVFGSNLSPGTIAASTLPLTTQLGGTQVILGGKPLPLGIATTGQINAIVPFDVQVNTTQQLLVQQGSTISVPEPVTIAAAQPAIFTDGKGAGIIVGVKADGTQFLVGASTPASANDVLVIYCSGLGAVDPPATAGSAASTTTLSRTVNPATVSVGGKDAPVLFAGLAPGFTGLYQINAIVPDGIAPGANVPLVVTVAGQQSVPVTVALK